MSSATEHRRIAVLLDTAGDALEHLMADLRAHHRPDVWRGRRADRFGRQLEARQRQLRMTVDELASQADDLRARADRLDLDTGPSAGG